MSDVGPNSEVEWMWGDAALLPGLHSLARLNPLRWQRLSAAACAATLQASSEHRPVHLRFVGEEDQQTFPSPAAASKWLLARLANPPHYWANHDVGMGFKDSCLLPEEARRPFQQLLDSTLFPASSRDRPCPARPPCRNSRKVAGGCACSRPGGMPGLPQRYRVRQVLRIEDSAQWQAFVRRRQELLMLRAAQGPVDDGMLPLTDEAVVAWPGVFASPTHDIGEMYLLHGTNIRSSLKIAHEDVRLDLSKSGGALGPGLYLAESATKADEYASDAAAGCVSGSTPDPYYRGIFAMLVMRACLGKPKVTNRFLSDTEKPKVKSDVFHRKLYDSIVGDRRSAGTFREFCLYDPDQVYVEYLVLYERIYADRTFGVPHLRELSGGGFSFQVPSYFFNFHKDPNIEAFLEVHPLRPRGMKMLQATLRLLCGRDGLSLKADRLEDSRMLLEYVAYKEALRRRLPGISNPGRAQLELFTSKQLDFIRKAGVANAFVIENVERDLNEVYLWAPVDPEVLRAAPSKVERVGLAAGYVRSRGDFYTSPQGAMRVATSGGPDSAAPSQILFLCRAVCGQIRDGTTERVDSCIIPGDPAMKQFKLTCPQQVYPEMMVWVEDQQSRSRSSGALSATI